MELTIHVINLLIQRYRMGCSTNWDDICLWRPQSANYRRKTYIDWSRHRVKRDIDFFVLFRIIILVLVLISFFSSVT